MISLVQKIRVGQINIVLPEIKSGSDVDIVIDRDAVPLERKQQI